MKYAELTAFGTPWDVCRVVDGPPLEAPGPGELNLRIEAGPINPAELLLIQGKYATRPELPVRLGIEGVGTVTAVGSQVSGLSVGDRVMSLGRTNWAEEIQVPAESVIPVSKDVDLHQLSMLKVNPATALLMLERYVSLKPGDWVIQNAANSAVGRYLIQLARAKGIRTINVVRRPELIAELTALGGDLVLLESDQLAQQVRAELGDISIPLAIDAIAGASTLRLGEALSEGGTVVNYGLLSGEPCQLTADMIIFKQLTLTGFWLAPLLGSMSAAEKQALYAGLVQQIANGVLSAPVEATYPLDQLADALRHADQQGRGGKILLIPNS